jgi:hypothetical protein
MFVWEITIGNGLSFRRRSSRGPKYLYPCTRASICSLIPPYSETAWKIPQIKEESKIPSKVFLYAFYVLQKKLDNGLILPICFYYFAEHDRNII